MTSGYTSASSVVSFSDTLNLMSVLHQASAIIGILQACLGVEPLLVLSWSFNFAIFNFAKGMGLFYERPPCEKEDRNHFVSVLSPSTPF